MLYSQKHPYLPTTATSPHPSLSSVPKVAVMERFDCISVVFFFSYQFFVASAAFWPSWSHPMDKFSPLLSLSLGLACLRVPALAIFCAYRVAAALISASSVMGGTPCLWRNLLCSFNASCSKDDPPGDK